ncbi:hypothetical protein [Actinomadura verrucosospora]|uniref:Guanylate cyclase domain-containing protein n=1 Tax=Actinomadura verrucosospora TaxID=46165 RepID=A0A7D3VSV3_ACTVE|nr:hypothetical protein [Actinomadura verrucosospora]QKG20034.1 hypothetical protein ACTIVE_1670 [Actinomadura verrucosospora]
MEEFRAVLVTDAEKFSAHRDVELAEVHMEIRRVLAEAFDRSGLGEAWEEARFKQSTGDGILAALPVEAGRALIDPFPRLLQEVLAEAAPGLRARGLHLRLRMALHMGFVDDAHPQAPGLSTAVVDVCRLVDSEPLRGALKRSDPEVTFAAFLVSSEMFATHVAGGRTRLRESQFTRVRVTVKQFDRDAYLYIPVPSQSPNPQERARDGEDGRPSRSRPAAAGTSIGDVSATGHGNQNAIGNTVGGDLNMDRS